MFCDHTSLSLHSLAEKPTHTYSCMIDCLYYPVQYARVTILAPCCDNIYEHNWSYANDVPDILNEGP